MRAMQSISRLAEGPPIGDIQKVQFKQAGQRIQSVEYQLAAQKLRPRDTVCMAAYGDYGPGYIGTEIAYSQGGYETSPGASNVAPSVERVLMKAIEELLK